MSNKYDDKTPLVSVIIPTYKRPTFLSRAIKSVEESTWSNIEVIIVDDNNSGDKYRLETEHEVEIVKKEYKNILYIKHEKNKNGSAARNTGIRNSHGKYIMFLDDDDEFLPLKIEKQVMFMESHDETWGACYTSYIDKRNGKIVARSGEKAEGDLLINELARNLFVHAGSNLMVRRSVAVELDGFNESFIRNQDVEFLVRILKKYKLGFVNMEGLVVHLHEKKLKVTFYEFTDHFLSTFSSDIAALQPKDKEAVLRMIGLQLVRQSIIDKNFANAKKYAKKYDASFIDITRYILFLCGRLLKHKSCSYPMNRLYRKG